MARTIFGELYDEVESGNVGGALPASTYDVKVTGARPRAESSIVFLTIEVLNGPQEGKETDVTLFVPKPDSKRGARVQWHKKTAGFDDRFTDALRRADEAPTLEAGFEVIADALIGQTVTAVIGVQGGNTQYAGSNELNSTSKLDGNGVTPTPTSAAFGTPSAEAAPAGNTPEGLPF